MDAAAFFHQHSAAAHQGDALHLPGWTLDDWHHLFAHASPVHLPTGEVLIRHGDRDRALYFVCHGALEVNAGGSRNETMGRLFRERPGSVLGEISLFDGEPRTATVWAIAPTDLLRIDLDGLRAFAAEHPARGHELLFALGRVLALRLRRGEERRRRD